MAFFKTADSLENYTQYFYSQSTGRLLATIYPEGDGVFYAYDHIGNLITVLPAYAAGTDNYAADYDSASVDYTYDATNRLKEIVTQSTRYTFVYDDFGNTTGISAGNNQLASYEYNVYNVKLSVLTYKNGL